jgi:hypothetical protein
VELGHLALLFFVLRAVRFVWAGLVTPRIGLRTRDDTGDIGVFAAIAVATSATTLAGLSSPRRFFFLLSGARAPPLPLAPRQWIPCSHLALL